MNTQNKFIGIYSKKKLEIKASCMLPSAYLTNYHSFKFNIKNSFNKSIYEKKLQVYYF